MNAELLRSILDYDPLSGVFTWRIAPGGRAKAGQVAGTKDEYGYTVIRYKGKGYKAHRLAWLYVTGEWPTNILDHINRAKDDNRFSNLRECDDAFNQMNVVATSGQSRSGIRGVSWFSQYQKWKATIQYHGRKHFLGHFDDPQEASAAYWRAKTALTAGQVTPEAL